MRVKVFWKNDRGSINELYKDGVIKPFSFRNVKECWKDWWFGKNQPASLGDGWPEDPDEDVAAGGWAGVVPITTTYGRPMRAPDCDETIPVPASVWAMSGEVANRRR